MSIDQHTVVTMNPRIELEGEDEDAGSTGVGKPRVRVQSLSETENNLKHLREAVRTPVGSGVLADKG